jgi:hypothetical protein
MTQRLTSAIFPGLRLLLVAILFFPLALGAQVEPEEDITAGIPADKKLFIGVKAGLGLARYYGDKEAFNTASSARPGIVGGVQVAYLLDNNIKSQFFVQGEVLFNSKGVRRESYIQQFEPDNQVRTNPTDTLNNSLNKFNEFVAQVQIPLSFKMNFGKDEVRPFFGIGPTVSLNLFGNAKRDSEIVSSLPRFDANGNVARDEQGFRIYDLQESTSSDKRALENLNLVEVGMNLSAGLEVPISATKLFVEVRYDLSFSRMYQDDAGQNKIRNNAWLFMLGVQF